MQYRIENDQLIPAPVNFRTPAGQWIMGFNLSPAKMNEYGFTITEAEAEEWRQQQPSSLPPAPDTTDFDNACQQFRDICHQIGQAIDQPDFKGGFEQMTLFAQSPVYSSIQGLKLAVSWSAANQLCKYQGQKLGYGQPQWWYYAWMQESDSK